MTAQEAQPTQQTPVDGSTDIKVGMISDVKNLYESKPDARGRTFWVNEIPNDLTAAAEDAESAKYALLIRNRKCFTGRKSLEIDSIVVQSPLLKSSLGQILKDYPGVTTSLDRLTFSAPFKPFVHRWKTLVRSLESESDPEAKAHLCLLHHLLEIELRDNLQALEDFILNGVITFSTCWMIFEPGVLVFSIDDGQPAVARLGESRYIKTRRGDDAYVLNCTTIDWDGGNFGLKITNFTIGAFVGTIATTRLAAFPLSYHPNIDKIRSELIERGRAFEALSGYHYKYYQGIGIGNGPWGPIKYNVDSRIIIDTYAWNRFNPNHQVMLSNLGSQSQVATSREAEASEDSECDDDADDDEESYDNVCCPAYGFGTDVDEASASEPKSIPLTETQLLMCRASLRGYSLKNKKWLRFSLRFVKDIKHNEGAFESLVLPSDHKELILALTESQIKNKETFDDVIQGKGKGMIMLLSGPPGVGKTLTAESLAEYMRVPLYMISAGDLGVNSYQVESALSNVLEMATKWNAILLLDEADIFLEQRSSNDLERNKLVSIFLRILEHYEGILFLTTNRVDKIDAAFQSRIHISMQYEELSKSSRKHVWTHFLAVSSKGKGPLFGDKDLDKLAEYKMNGREIKNVLKTAQLLASKKSEGLNIRHVESVLAIEQRHVGGKALIQGK